MSWRPIAAAKITTTCPIGRRPNHVTNDSERTAANVISASSLSRHKFDIQIETDNGKPDDYRSLRSVVGSDDRRCGCPVLQESVLIPVSRVDSRGVEDDLRLRRAMFIFGALGAGLR